jgi:glutamate 5-kinase
MPDLVRQEIATAAGTLVVKVGSRVLTRDDGRLDQDRIASLSEELAAVLDDGRRVVLVSSGAVAAGMGQLGLSRRPTDIAHLQAASAVGQSHLIEAYDRELRRHNRHAAQLLLTADDLNDRTRYLNVRNTLLALLDYGAVPIVNENDTVSVEELQISFGDNDRLAAMVTNLLRAPLLVLLSDVDGLYPGDPAQSGGKPVDVIDRIDDVVLGWVRDKATGLSKGGMASKLAAARIATAAGENVVIASGRQPGVLQRILAGESVGTLILPQGQTVGARKRWIGFAAQPRGALLLDAGAERAIAGQGRSLLAIGVIGVEGAFAKGDVVSLRGPDGSEFARGLSNYSSSEIRRLQGLKTHQIAGSLGHCPYDEVIHRDNLTLADNS